MALNYNLTLNLGNEGFGTQPTITANELPVELTPTELAREIHHENALIPESVASEVINHLMAVIARSMGEGKVIPLKVNGETFLRLYADMHLRETFDLRAAKARGFEGTVLTEEAAALITPSDIIIKAKAEVEQKFTEAVRDAAKREGIQRKGIQRKAYVAKKDSDTPNTPATPDTGNGGERD